MFALVTAATHTGSDEVEEQSGPGLPRHPKWDIEKRGMTYKVNYFNQECRLQIIVHFADKWTAAVEEEGRSPRAQGFH
ncbi:MAG: hypothetical protein ABR899_04175 [Candidatus Krumholzibacteriaceae bacterium]|jgi:hypothetical protein